MKFRTWMWTAVVFLLANLAVTIGLAAQDNPSQNSVVLTDDHDHGPQNGPLAVATVTVIDGGYGTFQLATLPKDGGPYHFLTTVDTVPNGAHIPDFTPDGRNIFFGTFGDANRGDYIISVPVEGGPLTPT